MKLVTASAVLLVGALAFAALGRFEARLTGAGDDKGKAKFVAKARGGQYQAQLEVEAENLAPNTAYSVHVGAGTWPVTTNALGAFNMAARYTNANQHPDIGAGTNVRITGANNAVVLNGSFAAR